MLKRNSTRKTQSGQRAFVSTLLAGTMLTAPLFTTVPALAAPPSQAIAAPASAIGFANVIAKAKPAVVSILVTKANTPSSDQQQFYPEQLPEGLQKFFKRFGAPNDEEGHLLRG